jgi:spore germination protein YaaH
VKTLTLRCSIALALAATLLVPAAAPAHAKKRHQPSCYKQTPSVLQFTRAVGNPSGLLSWRPPRQKVPVERRGRTVGYHYRYFTASSYRVYRGSAVVGETRKRWMTVPVKPGQSYQFRVRVVNGRGKQSGCRGAVLAKTLSLLPPGQPTGLAATVTSDASIGLSWQPGPRGDGTPAGYRVFRDGTPIGQVAGASIQVGNLFPGRDYSFTVQAVDTAGRMSPPSLPLLTSTRPPVQTNGKVQAFLLATTDQSFRDLQAHYMDIGTVMPTYFDCDKTGQVVGQDDPLVTGWSKRRGIMVMPRYNCQNGTVEHKIFTDPATREANLSSLVALVQQNGYDGVNLDFEAAPATDRDAVSQFVEDLGARLHAIGRKLSVDVSPKTRDTDPNYPRGNTFDYPALNQYADSLFLMMWGVHWSTSWPGPLADMSFMTTVLNYADQAVPDRSKWVLGTPMYGLDWPAGGGINHPATPREYQEIMGLAAQYHGTPQWDPAAQEMSLGYTDSSGVSHQVWFENAQSIGARMALAKAHGFGGIGVWHLGSEDQAAWSLPIVQPGGY